jgi:hypothetical protein
MERQAALWPEWWCWYVGLTRQVSGRTLVAKALDSNLFLKDLEEVSQHPVDLLLYLNDSLAAGTGLQYSQCPSSGSGGTTNCFAAFLALHLTSGSTAYLEVML